MSVIVLGYGTITRNGSEEKERQEIKKKGVQIYRYLQPILEPFHNGKLILIDTETEEYLIGDEKKETFDLAWEKFKPHGVFHCRVGDGSRNFDMIEEGRNGKD